MPSVIRTPNDLVTELKRLRDAKDWSQGELGACIGLSQARVSTIENHPEHITVDQLFTVLMALGAEIQICPRGKVSGEDW